MSLVDQINSYNQKYSYRVYFGGAPLYHVTHIHLDGAFDQVVQRATITTPVYYQLEPGMVYPVEIWQGYGGFETRTFFGYADRVNHSAFPNELDIECSDALKKARETWLDDGGVSFSNTQAEDAVRQLMALAGLSVNAGVSHFPIGDLHPSEFKLVSVLDACNQIAALLGWAIWATTDGTVVFDYKKPLPGVTPFWTYRDASSPSATDGNIIGKFRHTIEDDSLRNRAVVIGNATLRAEASAGSPYVPSPPTYRTEILSSELIDTQPMANAMAARLLADTNHLWESCEFDIPGNPLLKIGTTVKCINHFSRQNANYFLFGFTSDMGKDSGYVMRLTVCGGNSSPFDYNGGEDQKPTASFTYTQMVWGDPTIVLYVDGSSSSSPDGTITDYDWDWGDGTPHTAGASAMASHKYDYSLYMTTVAVTLTVTDDRGQTATCTKSIVLGDITDEGFAYHVIYAGGPTKLHCSPDSGLHWNVVAVASQVNAISCNVTRMKGKVIAGCQGGHLYQVNNYGAAVTLKYTFGSAVTACYIDQSDDKHWVIGLSNGDLYETPDALATAPTLVHSFGESVRQYLFINPASPNEWFAPTSTKLNHSFDSGGAWLDNLANWANGSPTVKKAAWHFMQHMVAAVSGGTRPLGYTSDNGQTWQNGNLTSGTPNAVTGAISAPGDFAAALASTAFVYVTTDGITWAAGGSFLNITAAVDLLYSWKVPFTLIACE